MSDSNQAARPGPQAHRRATVRYRCDPALPDRLFIADSYRCLAARVLGLSRAGVGLLVEDRIEPGTHVSIELEEGDRGATVELQAEVAHATAWQDGTWRCACRLHQLLTGDELAVLSR